ncbi:Selenophosphate synthetase [Monocercomonoides exilis]|uniref:Selenophosphate synthetase n=1 Tax=Monocercomonoides exilis TaxID=2049356 RepID=UPI00355A3F7B|nr:Selenophosphate synthetase [Monocercomonoides exilis]|eukprot:MONOS_5022.1-p1 / transcript=MONOS_5022.1 / gene=MONOS_5022 / organism=Monocercomonoides_exilis_PA203 / gene_product=Selenophosphate synthetase / transcript_product=Selenophosphate synthetase / location=Mono_scaffold00141:93108-95289(-) / protein_length=621 / sequence_SO=supercontig / SO=protein_coding / is_pseudo=false
MTCFVPRTISNSNSSASSFSSALSSGTPKLPLPGEVKLTQYASGLGCACKVKAELLESLIPSSQQESTDSSLLVGIETGDDASVYKLDDDNAIINTTDFFPPIVDDAETYGKIAAANALSDVYAMGGKPITALSIVGFPTGKLPADTLKAIFKGARTKASESGIIIGGGHTIDVSEPIFGLAVTGVVHPQKFIRNVGVKAGDWLLLTKPLGTGIATSAMKRGEQVCPEETSKAAIESMTALNRIACEVVTGDDHIRSKIHAMTDVTGFGLAGHLKKMIRKGEKETNNLVATIYANQLPLLPGVVKLLQQRGLSVYSTSSFNNVSFASASTLFSQPIQEPQRLLVFDAQTSGGLLMAVEGTIEEVSAIAQKIQERLPEGMLKESVKIIGRVEEADPARNAAVSQWMQQRSPSQEAEGAILVVQNEEEASKIMAMQTGEEIANALVQMSDCNLGPGFPHSVQVAPVTLNPPQSASSSSKPSADASSSSSSAPSSKAEFVQTAPQPPTLDMSLVWFYKNSVVTLGDDTLGKLLARGLLQTLASSPVIPGKIIFMGDSVEMTTITNETVNILRDLERMGVTIWSCITCLVTLKLKEKVRVGRAATSKEIVSVLSDSSKRIVTMS